MAFPKKSKHTNGYELKINVIKGTHLASKDSNGLSDPYLIVKIENLQQKTKIIKMTLEPQWNETLTFMLPIDVDMNVTPVNFICMDWERTGLDDYMGEFSVLLRDFVKEAEEKPTAYKLNSATGEYVSGTITMSCTLKQLPTQEPHE